MPSTQDQINSQSVDYSGGSGNSVVGSILSAVPLVGGVLNGVSQIFTNAKNRKFQEKMYDRQRSDALTDWNMQNAYNTPSAQMARLRAAGLNPNLVYGHGADSQEAAPVRSSSPSGVSGQAPRFDTSSAIPMLMFQLNSQMMEQRIDNLKTQNTVLQTMADKNNATTSNITADTAIKNFDLSMKETLSEITKATAQGRLDQLYIGNDVALAANERAAARTAVDLQQGILNILHTRLENETMPLRQHLISAQIDAVEKNNQLRQLSIDLEKKGLTWSDPVYYRIGSSIIDKLTSGAANPVASPGEYFEPNSFMGDLFGTYKKGQRPW